MLIAHITDLHMRPAGSLAYGVAETNLYVEQAINAILRQDPAPDCVLISGDLTDCGLDEEYDLLAALLARLPMPVFVVPGNHDRREVLRAAFAKDGYLPTEGYLNYTVDLGGVRLIGLDTVVAGENHGELAAETLEFLRDTLDAYPQDPTIIMQHHQPFDLGITVIDSQRLLAGVQEQEALIAAHPQVQRLLCGHAHRCSTRLFGRTLAQVAPSVGHQVGLNLAPDAELGFVLEPGKFMLHLFDGQSILSHVVETQRAPGPYPFTLPPEYPGAQG